MNKYFGLVGDAIWLSVFGITMYYAIRIEKVKKENDIYTYKEIVAFQNGVKLDEIEKSREKKRTYQTIIFVLVSAVVGIIMTALLHRLFDLF